LADRGTGRSLTRRDLADPARDLAGLADLDLDLVRGRDLAAQDPVDREPGRGTDRGDPVELGRGTDRGDPVERGLAARGDRADQRDPAGRGLAALGDLGALAERGRAARGDLADRGRAARGDLADRDRAAQRDLADRGLAARGDLADRGLAARGDLGDLVARGDLADRDRLDGRRGALTIGVMTRWVAPWMRPVASAHATTARHLRRKREDSAGTMGLLPVGRRVTGSARRLRVVGTVLRPLVVGTARGTGRSAA
jgi:hypothetical protein